VLLIDDTVWQAIVTERAGYAPHNQRIGLTPLPRLNHLVHRYSLLEYDRIPYWNSIVFLAGIGPYSLLE
jgi:hypothetical protein